ncbi:MAG: hypothetical protein JSS95_10140 [Acidobacteria bacterium]|nr:hypothetical protein [Acidobacteriota bacterium]
METTRVPHLRRAAAKVSIRAKRELADYGSFIRDPQAHLRDDETIAKMGHPTSCGEPGRS